MNKTERGLGRGLNKNRISREGKGSVEKFDLRMIWNMGLARAGRGSREKFFY